MPPSRGPAIDDRLRQCEKAAAADALHGPADDEDSHVGGQRADQRAGEEDHDGRINGRPPPVNVGDAAIERRHRRRGEKITGDDPGQVVGMAKGCADGGHRRRDDGLVERRQQHRQENPGDDGILFRFRQSGAGCDGLVVDGLIHGVTIACFDVEPMSRERVANRQTIVSKWTTAARHRGLGLRKTQPPGCRPARIPEKQRRGLADRACRCRDGEGPVPRLSPAWSSGLSRAAGRFRCAPCGSAAIAGCGPRN